MKQTEFDHLAEQGYNRIPLAKEVLADLDTPLSTYLKLADGAYSYLFESVQSGEKWGRYSIIGLPCETVVKVCGNDIEVSHQDSVIETATADDPLAWVEAFKARYNVPEIDGLPKFNGGLVGYFGYDTVRYVEKRLGDSPNPDPLDNPDILLMVSDEVVVFDNLSGRLYIVIHVDPAQDNAYQNTQQRLEDLTSQLRESKPKYHPAGQGNQVSETDFVSGFTHDGFVEAVEKAKQYITDGDIMQVVLSQRLSIPFAAQSMDLYRALRTLNPSPYMYYLNLGDVDVVGSSPEILVRMEDGQVTVRPIAGTRPRGKTKAEDKALEQDLLGDPKELAEHLMLIDLGRNDAGRVSEIGSVELTDKWYLNATHT
jgi:anthranilate synthase component 1